MIIFADHNCLSPELFSDSNNVFLNLSSLLEGFDRVNILPPFNINRQDKDFDMYYHDYIFSNDNVFYEFMKIVMTIYYNKNIIILVTKDDFYSLVSESLMKILQQRYGLISNNINNIDDLNYVVECEFTLNGIYNMDIDKERFVNIYAKYNRIE